MPDLKQELTELIEAFAVARKTDNARLIQQSALAVVQFLESVELSEKVAPQLAETE